MGAGLDLPHFKHYWSVYLKQLLNVTVIVPLGPFLKSNHTCVAVSRDYFGVAFWIRKLFLVAGVKRVGELLYYQCIIALTV